MGYNFDNHLTDFKPHILLDGNFVFVFPLNRFTLKTNSIYTGLLSQSISKILCFFAIVKKCVNTLTITTIHKVIKTYDEYPHRKITLTKTSSEKEIIIVHQWNGTLYLRICIDFNKGCTFYCYTLQTVLR